MTALRMALASAAMLAAAFGATLPTAEAAGFLVPARPGRPVDEGWAVEQVKVRAQVRGSHAFVTTQIVFRNTSPRTIEAECVVPLPEGGLVAVPALTVDGRPAKPELLTGTGARAAMREILTRHRDARLIETLGSDILRIRPFALAAESTATVAVTYEQEIEPVNGIASIHALLRGATLAPAKDARYQVDVDIELSEGNDPRAGVDSRVGKGSFVEIGPVHSPTHEVTVRRDHARHALVHAEGTLTADEPDLRLFWTTTRSQVGATMLTYWPPEAKRGYFVLLAAPSGFERARLATRPSDLTFMVDTSGSMSGDRLEAVRGTLLALFDDLDEDDRLNVIAFGDAVRTLWPSPRAATAANRSAARAFVARLRAEGATNLDAALAQASKMRREAGRSSAIVLVTDGRPTRGERARAKLLARISDIPQAERPRVYALGIGVDVDAAVLDGLAARSGGRSVYVRPFRSPAPAMRALYESIRRSVLTEPELRITGIEVSDVMPARLPDLAEGGAVFVTGRYAKGGRAEIELAEGGGGYTRREFGTLLWAGGRGDTTWGAFPARIWALRRIAHGLDQLRTGGDDVDRGAEARAVLELSARFGLLTEYTSFLADESSDHTATVRNVQRSLRLLADMRTGRTDAASFAYAKNQAGRRAALRAPMRTQDAWLPGEGGRDIARVTWHGLRQAGEGTFYWRRGLGWVDAGIENVGEVENRVARWSDAFFELLAKTTRTENARLAQRGSLLLRIGGRVVRIVDDR